MKCDAIYSQLLEIVNKPKQYVHEIWDDLFDKIAGVTKKNVKHTSHFSFGEGCYIFA